MSQISFADAKYAGKSKKTRREVFLVDLNPAAHICGITPEVICQTVGVSRLSQEAKLVDRAPFTYLIPHRSPRPRRVN